MRRANFYIKLGWTFNGEKRPKKETSAELSEPAVFVACNEGESHTLPEAATCIQLDAWKSAALVWDWDELCDKLQIYISEDLTNF